MTNWYDNDEEFAARGIDYDLCACLDYNPQNTFVVEDIKKVWAVWEGEGDGDDWRWVLELNSGQFVFLQGGCDYTGWDCQSWATHAFADTPEQAAEKAMGDVSIENSSPVNAGLGHMLNLIGGTYGDNFTEVRDSLLKQVQEGKQKTWTEQKEEEFKVPLSSPNIAEHFYFVGNIIDLSRTKEGAEYENFVVVPFKDKAYVGKYITYIKEGASFISAEELHELAEDTQISLMYEDLYDKDTFGYHAWTKFKELK